MARFQNAEVTFEVPDDWVDQTAVIYAERVGKGIPATVALVRNAFPPSGTLEERVAAVTRKLFTELARPRSRRRTGLSIDSVPAVQLLVEWKHPAAESITQLITLFLRDDTFWSFTATVPSKRIDAVDWILQKVMSSLRIAKRRGHVDYSGSVTPVASLGFSTRAGRLSSICVRSFPEKLS